MDDAMGSLDAEDLEDEAEEEVNKVIFEVTNGILICYKHTHFILPI